MAHHHTDTVDELRQWAFSARDAYRAEGARDLDQACSELTPAMLDKVCELIEGLEECDSAARGALQPDAEEEKPASLALLESRLDARLETLQTQLVEKLVDALLQPLAGEVRGLAEHSKAIRDLADQLVRRSEQQSDSNEHADASRLRIENLLSETSGDEEIERLESDLQAAQQEIDDLRRQNAELASQVAKAQVSGAGQHPHLNFDLESLPWEERKKRILEQLEADEAAMQDRGDGDADVDGDAVEELEQTRIEVERVLAVTDREIQRREQEIAELRRLVEQQAEARDGIAVGAAAVAQMLETEPLIEEERRKLQEIQRQWEEKLREAEIELSMERAKLARERRELEAEKEELRTKLEAIEASTELPSGRRRRWLDHLGLRDDKE